MTPFWVPICAALLSSLASLGAGYFLLTRTETYKRLSGWQAYHQQLWKTKADVLLQLVHAASQAGNQAMRYVFAEEPELREAELALNAARHDFYTLFLQTGVLCTSHFHEPGILFMEQIGKADEWRHDREMGDLKSDELALTTLNQLIFACRSELHIEPLQEAARAPGHTFATFPPQYVQGPLKQ